MVSSVWSLNFAAGAATGALFAPGAFQQSGWLMAITVSLAAFIFSLASFAAYCSLTSIAFRAMECNGKGFLRWATVHKKDDDDNGGGVLNLKPLTVGGNRFRAAVCWKLLSWSQSTQDSKKKKGMQSVAALDTVKDVPEASFLIDFFGGSRLLTVAFEAVQLIQLLSGFVLKTATAVDLLVTFMLENEAHLPFAIPDYLRPFLTTDAFALITFALLTFVCLLPSAQTYQKVIVRGADIFMIILHGLLAVFLVKHMVQHAGVEKHIYRNRVPVEGMHLSQTFPLHEKFYFCCAAILTGFIPHCNTPSILREKTSKNKTSPSNHFHILAQSQITHMMLQLVYFLSLGIMLDTVLPTGRTTSRAAVFNFVDYRTWLPEWEKESKVIMCFALVPLVHLVAAGRGCTEGVVNVLLRILPGNISANVGTGSSKTALYVAAAFIITQVSITWRPLYWLIWSNCVLHAVYLTVYLVVWRQRHCEGEEHNKTKSASPSRRQKMSLLEHLLSPPAGSTATTSVLGPVVDVDGVATPKTPVSCWYRSRAFMWVALCFWVTCFLYWVS